VWALVPTEVVGQFRWTLKMAERLSVVTRSFAQEMMLSES